MPFVNRTGSCERCLENDWTECHFCDMPLSKRHEHDHFPTPLFAGGTEVVPICLNCHDLKDRIPLSYWSIGALWKGVAALMPFVDGPVTHENLHEHIDFDAVEAALPDLPPMGRLLYGKMIRIIEMDAADDVIKNRPAPAEAG
jgi:hypothetical protein